MERDGVTGRIAGVEGPVDALGVGFDDAGRGVQDILGGAIIFAQADHRGAGKIALEAEDVADVGVAPGVDALVGVADHAEVLVGPGEELSEAILGDVGVLEFVNEEITVTPVILGLYLWVLLQQMGGANQQIVKVQGILPSQRLLVVTIDPGAGVDPVRAIFVVAVVSGPRHGVGVLEDAFGGRDAGKQSARVVALGIHVGQLHG